MKQKYFIVWHDADGVHVKSFKEEEVETFLGLYSEICKGDCVIDLVVKGEKLKVEPVERPAEFKIA
jgi:hypothetical protein